LAFEAEGGGDFGPVEFQGGGALGVVLAEMTSQVYDRRQRRALTYCCCHSCEPNGNGCLIDGSLGWKVTGTLRRTGLGEEVTRLNT